MTNEINGTCGITASNEFSESGGFSEAVSPVGAMGSVGPVRPVSPM